MKLLIVGAAGVGKSQILSRYTEDSFTETYLSTIGIDFRVKTVEILGKTIKFQIWDSAGQERFRSISQSYYRSASGVLLVYDITDSQTFEDLKTSFFNDVMNHNPLQVVLVGNKKDREGLRQVERSTAEQWANANQLTFAEVSAKDGGNIDFLFEELGKALLGKMFGVYY